MNNFDLNRQWYDWGSENPFKGLPHEDPRNHIEELESLVSRCKQNEISEDHILCKIFPYTISGGAFSWFSKLQPRSLTCWEDIKSAFLEKFFSEAVATRSKRLDYMIDKMIEDHEKGIMTSTSQIFDYVYSEQNGDSETPTTHVNQPDIQVQHADEGKQRNELNRGQHVNHSTVEEDEQHGHGEPNIAEEVETSHQTSPSVDTMTSTSIDSSTLTSLDINTSASVDTQFCHRSTPLEIPERSSCPQDIADSTQKSTDVSSCYLASEVEKEITMEDFLELEKFLELEDGKQLGDLDSSEEVTMEDFLELEDWLEDLDQNLEQKLDDE